MGADDLDPIFAPEIDTLQQRKPRFIVKPSDDCTRCDTRSCIRSIWRVNSLCLSRLDDACYAPQPWDKATCVPTSKTTWRCKSLSMTRCYHNLPVGASMRGVSHCQEGKYVFPSRPICRLSSLSHHQVIPTMSRVLVSAPHFEVARSRQDGREPCYSAVRHLLDLFPRHTGGRHAKRLLLNNILAGGYRNHKLPDEE